MKYKKYRDGGFDSLPQVFADGGMSRFESPVQSVQGIESFELPYNEIATALLSKQKQQDTLKADLDAEDSVLSSLKEGYDTKGLAAEVRNDYNRMINELSNQELDASKINKLKRLIRNDSRIGLLAKSAKEADLYDKYRQTHKDFNLWVQPQLDNEGNWKQAKDEQGNWLSNTDYQGYINNLTPYNYYLAEVDDAGKNLKANLQKVYGADASVFKGEDGYLYVKKRGEATRKRLDENDPQYKAALESVTDAWVNKSTPGSSYLHARYEKNGIPFDRNEAKKIVDDRLKTFTFSEANRNESVDLAPQYLYGVDDETKSSLIPFGETPAEDRAALFNNLDFLNLHKKGEAVKSTAPIYTSSSGIPLSSPPMRTSDGYDQLEYQSMSLKQLNTITNSVRNLVNAGKLDQKILDKVLKKENLTAEEQKTLYPKLQSTLKRLTENEKINSQYEGLSEKESEAVTMYYFGIKNPIAKNIGTGNSGNVTIYDPQTGNKLKLADLKKEVGDSEEPIQISTQLRGNNTYNYMFGENNDLVNPYQLFVNGKMYLLPSPKGWYGEGANALNMKKALDLVTNKFTNSYISAAPEKLDDEYDAVYDDQDNTYKIYHNGKPLEIKSDAGETFENKFTSPQEAATVYFSYKQAKK